MFTRSSVLPGLALAIACARADVSGTSSSEPTAPQAATEVDPVTKVCEHIWALLIVELAPADEIAAESFATHMEHCTASGEAERASVGDDEFQRQATCALAAGTAAELRACDPNAGPPSSPREPARFPEDAIVRPLSEVMDHAVYSPDPDHKDLQQTKAARFDRADGVSTVAFCVATDGTTSDIHTVQKFPGDPMIDTIIRDTIARWRFKPFVVDGAAAKVCTEKQFKLLFK